MEADWKEKIAQVWNVAGVLLAVVLVSREAGWLLDRLGLEDGRQLLQALLQLEDRLAERVWERAAGNPHFAVQIVATWLADGLLELKVEATSATDVRCTVVVGGELGSNKGINLPQRSINAPILSGKDRRDLEFGLAQGVDYVALSFVRTGHDVTSVKRIIEKAVRGMLPHNSLGRQMFRKLKVYPEGTHPHVAQQPEPLSL